MRHSIYTYLILILATIAFSTAASNTKDKALTLKCLYHYSTSVKSPKPVTDYSYFSFSPFTITANKDGIAPSFCDTVTRGFSTDRLHYVHCQSKNKAVRTEHKMMVDRKTLTVTTQLDFYLDDKFMNGIIHIGKCQYQTTQTPAKTSSLTNQSK